MEKDHSGIIKNKNHYENVSERIKQMNDKLLEDRARLENKTKKKKRKNKERSDIEKMLLEKTFETESLPREYLKIMYKELTGHLPDEKEYNNLLHDLKSKGYVFSENGQPYEPKYNPNESEENNIKRFRTEWEEVKNNIKHYLEKEFQDNYKGN